MQRQSQRNRYGVVGLLIFLFAITYIDRVCISVAGPRMQADLHIDPIGWDRTPLPPPPFLDPLQQAVVDGVQVRLGYQGADKPAGERVVHPLGLAAKGPVWYLLADTPAGLRTFRISRVTSVEPTGEPVVRPVGFELGAAWRSVTEVVDERRRSVRATALAQRDALGALRATFGSRLSVGGPAADGRIEVEVASSSSLRIAVELAGFGAAVAVVGPPDVRDHLARIGHELSDLYPTRAGHDVTQG